ncbi:hypothetical protein NQ318_003285 [Aromia moschata]|uniref:Sperm-associated antigen 1 n=1 Tax=Aromia moschata TaxID=1265417 RepID=A0AAV8YMN5_9CUCU|nr:hypothetical protein NQ318_003285 [Aromia moschata]
MSTLSDLPKLVEEESSYREKETLLSKYQIPIKHFELDYIENCRDAKEIEKIYHVLLSGEEGDYPHLLKAAEERLSHLKPKSRWLRKTCSVINKESLDKDALQELSQDLESWVSNISKHSRELDTRKTDTVKCDAEIRAPKPLENAPSKPKEQRISSTNYSAWDKYDPDTEILKMELDDEKVKKAALEGEKQKEKRKPKKAVSFNRFATEAEAIYVSNREREKGNEFFKSGDYEEALQCYTDSISSKPSVDNLNNRAVTYLKLKKYKLALHDCDRVLTIQRDNLKAHLRKGEALEKLERYEEALGCAEFVIQKDPNNECAQELAGRAREHCEAKLTNTRMKIVEIE